MQLETQPGLRQSERVKRIVFFLTGLCLLASVAQSRQSSAAEHHYRHG